MHEVVIATEKLLLLSIKKENEIRDKIKEDKCLSKVLDLYMSMDGSWVMVILIQKRQIYQGKIEGTSLS